MSFELLSLVFLFKFLSSIMFFWSRNKFKHPSGRMLSPRHGNDGSFRVRQYFWQRRSFKVYAALAAVGFLFLAYILFWSGVFRIQNIQVTGTKTLDAGQIEAVIRDQLGKSRFGVFSQSNLWFFSSKMAENDLRSRFVIDSVQIKKRPLKTLKIEVKEKNNQIVYISNGRYYYLDPSGLAVKEVLVANVTLVAGETAEATAPAAGSGESLIDLSVLEPGLPLIYDLSDTEVKIGQKIIDPEVINFTSLLQNKLIAGGLEPESFQLPTRQGTEVRAVLKKGYSVYFNTADDLDRQLANLNLILREKVKDQKINYINLMFGNRVFIK